MRQMILHCHNSTYMCYLLSELIANVYELPIYLLKYSKLIINNAIIN